MMRTLPIVLLLSVIFLSLSFPAGGTQDEDPSLSQLEEKLKSQYAAIEKIIANPPSPADSPALVRTPGQPPYDLVEHRRRIRLWQDDLAQGFKAAADTVAEILKLNPPNRDYWSERLATLQLYAEPVSRPEERTIFGRSEVQKPAKMLETPLAVYTDEAKAARAKGDVRLRLVLAADGTVKYVFPIKSMRYGLTESALTAARQIKFEPAIRNGSPASVFVTLVYEFEKGGARKPYFPRSEF